LSWFVVAFVVCFLKLLRCVFSDDFDWTPVLLSEKLIQTNYLETPCFATILRYSGKILIWDAAQCKLVREMAGHENRVGTMAWNSTLLASGSRDRNILLQDIRVR